MGDDGGYSGDTGGYSEPSGGFEDNRGYTNDREDDYSGFRGKENGNLHDDRYASEESKHESIDDRVDHIKNDWNGSDNEKDDDRNTGVSSVNALTVLGGGDDKVIQNGDGPFSPMLMDEGDSGQAYGRDQPPERNPCEDCFFGTLVCCDCTIL